MRSRSLTAGPSPVWSQGNSTGLFHPLTGPLNSGGVQWARLSLMLGQSSNKISVRAGLQYSDTGDDWDTAEEIGPAYTASDGEVFGSSFEDLTAVGTRKLFVRFGVFAKNTSDSEIELVEGHWTSTDWGEMYLRIQSDDSLRGVYTYYDGRVVADFAAGQLDGWWSESPDREPPDAGLVEWDLLVEDDGTKRMEGRWATGDGTLDNEWPLEWVDDMIPADIEALFANDDEFVDGR